MAFATIPTKADVACRSCCALQTQVRSQCKCSAMTWWHGALCNVGSETLPTGMDPAAKTTHQQQGVKLAAGKM